MSLIYRLANLYPAEVETLIKWCKAHPPTPWEKAYNDWVKHSTDYNGHCNPLIENQDHWLVPSVLKEVTNFNIAELDEALGEIVFSHGALTFTSILPDPWGPDRGHEQVNLTATAPVTGKWRIADTHWRSQEILPDQIPKPGEMFTLTLKADGPTLPNNGGKLYIQKFENGKWVTMEKIVYPHAESGKWIKFKKYA